MQDEQERTETPPPEPAVAPPSVAAETTERAAADGRDRPPADEGAEGARGAAPGDRRRRHYGRRRVCSFCVEKVTSIDYKDPVKLRRYLSDRARVEPRRKTGTCAKHQRWLSRALKRARHLALLPYTPEHIRVTGMFAARR